MKIKGSEIVEKLFGYWPTFHDAEIHSFLFERDKQAKNSNAILKLNYWQTKQEYSDEIHYEYVMNKNSIITFKFSGLIESNLSGFNHQNVIDELKFTEQDNNILVEYESIFGSGGSLICENAEIINIEAYEEQA